VISTVTVGLILGNYGSRVGMNPRTRIIVAEFWEFVAFFVNSILFLLIGDQLRFESDWVELRWIVITIAAVLISRLIVVYGLTWISNRVTRTKLNLATQTMLWWGGLRGGVSIALALSIPAEMADRRIVVALVFSVVFFTILVQGLTSKPVLEALGLVSSNPFREEYLELNSRQIALRRMLDYLSQPSASIGVEPQVLQAQQASLQQQLSNLQAKSSELVQQDPSLKEVGLERLQDALLLIETNTYAELVKIGQLDQELDPLLEATTEQAQEVKERFSLSEATES
jgi:monovalent cation:H+ antiporter, CPA1 family